MENITAIECPPEETSDHAVVPSGPDSAAKDLPNDRESLTEDESSGNDEDEEGGEEDDEEEEEEPVPKRDLIAELAEVINKEKSTHCCGGIFAVKSGVGTLEIIETTELKFPPVVVLWDVPGSNQVRKLTLGSSMPDTSSLAITDLIKDCAPATFGYNGQDVLDSTYRQAVELDSNQFCSTFNPTNMALLT